MATYFSFSTLSSWWPFGGLRRDRGTQFAAPRIYPSAPAAPVTWDTAMQISAFWACCRLIAETVASLPLNLYRQQGTGRVVDVNHPLQLLLSGKFNAFQTKQEFFETEVLNLVTHGNFYAHIERNGAGDIISLVPLMASQMEPRLLPDATLVYIYQSDGGTKVFAQGSIWHVKLFGNGLVGLSPLAYARNSLGIAQAGEDRVGAVYRNGAKPTGVLMYDRLLTKEQRAQIRENFRELAEGNTDSLFILEAGMKYESVSMSPVDIEMLESRRFQVEDICRFMGVPSILVNDASNSTGWGSGIQQLIEGWYKLGLRPHLERIEASARCSLLSPADRIGRELEFDFDALLRADAAARFDGYQKGINAGVLMPNEARRWEGLPPAPGGDQLLVNGTMVPVSQAGAPRAPGALSGALSP